MVVTKNKGALVTAAATGAAAAAAGTVSVVEADAGAGRPLTKRQRRIALKNSDKNKLPQHPHIKSAEARERAYLRTAGLLLEPSTSTDKKKDKKQKKGKEDDNQKADKEEETAPEAQDDEAARSFALRALGATDARVRHAAVLKLKTYLKAKCSLAVDDESDASRNVGISELELMKLWKGLWYALYMADRVPVQDALSQQIAKLLWCFAGTPEEDEYAGHAYLELLGEDEGVEHDDDDNDEEDGDQDDDDEDEEIRDEEAMDDEEKEGENEEEDDMSVEEEIVKVRKGKKASDASDDDEEEEDGEDEDEEDDGEQDHYEEVEIDNAQEPHCRGAHLASLFVRTFFQTVYREWGKMDKYRVDKFYTLARYMVHEIYQYMADRQWSLGICRLFNDALYDEVLTKSPNGLRYHLIDITLDELAKVNAAAPMPLTEATFLDCMEPYFALVQHANDAIVQQRVIENILQKFLFQYSVVRDANIPNDAKDGDDREDAKGDDTKDELVMDQIHVGTIAQFVFEIASDADTKNAYRKTLYDLHKLYVRRIKLVGKDVPLPEQEEGEDEGGGCHGHHDHCHHDHGHDHTEKKTKKSEPDKSAVKQEPDETGNSSPLSKTTTKEEKVQAAGEIKGRKKNKGSKSAVEVDKGTEKMTSSQSSSKNDKGKKSIMEDAKKSPETTHKKVGKDTAQMSKVQGKESQPVGKKARKEGSATDTSLQQKSTKQVTQIPSNDSSLSKERTQNKSKKSADDRKSAHGAPSEISMKEEATHETVSATDGKQSDQSTQKDTDAKPSKRRNRKKKNKKQNQEPPSTVVKHEEEEITISLKDQITAKKALEDDEQRPDTTTTPAVNKKRKQGDTSDSGSDKRVKFVNLNHARSWKASMKALRTMDPPTTVTTPEKSILLNKGKVVSAKPAKSKRKKAVDYFYR